MRSSKNNPLIELNPSDFRIISEDCLEIEKDLHLYKSGRGDDIVILFASRDGTEKAVRVVLEKMKDHSMEHILSLFHDRYYLEKLRSAVTSL